MLRKKAALGQDEIATSENKTGSTVKKNFKRKSKHWSQEKGYLES